MNSSCAESGPADSSSFGEPADRLFRSERDRPVHLAVETVLVTAAALIGSRLLHARPVAGLDWLLIPGLLVAAALLPTWMARREFPRIGLDPEHARRTFRTLGVVCAIILPVVFAGLWTARRFGVPAPLQPVIVNRADWLAWLLYQFLYVAVAEEVFFRGYVQANVMRFLKNCHGGSRTVQQSIAIVVSAACFASAHVVVQGRAIALLTFVPGLLLAWLFIRTRALLAPILFHGLANISYGIMALTLA